MAVPVWTRQQGRVLGSGSEHASLLVCVTAATGWLSVQRNPDGPELGVLLECFGTVVAAAVFMAVVYAVTSYLIIANTGTGQAQSIARRETGSLVFFVSNRALGSWASDVFQILIITSIFAAIVTFHNNLSRYLYALGPGTGVGAPRAHPSAPQDALRGGDHPDRQCRGDLPAGRRCVRSGPGGGTASAGRPVPAAGVTR